MGNSRLQPPECSRLSQESQGLETVSAREAVVPGISGLQQHRRAATAGSSQGREARPMLHLGEMQLTNRSSEVGPVGTCAQDCRQEAQFRAAAGIVLAEASGFISVVAIVYLAFLRKTD